MFILKNLIKNSFLPLIVRGRWILLSDTYRETQIPYMLTLLNAENSEIVLDAGCGSGQITCRLGGYVIGVDVNYEAIKVACERVDRLNHGPSFLVATLTHLPFKDKVFDKVLCSSVLQFIPSYRKALHEIKRVGKGVIVLNIPSHTPFLIVPSELERKIWHGFKAYHKFRLRSLVNTLREMGFGVDIMVCAPTLLYQFFYEVCILEASKICNNNSNRGAKQHSLIYVLFSIFRWILAFIDILLPRVNGTEFIIRAREIVSNQHLTISGYLERK